MRSPRVRGVRGEGGASDGQVFLVLRRGEPERLRRGPPQQRQARRPASLVQERHRASRVRGGVRRQARLARRPHGQVPRRGVRATRRIQRDGVCLLGSPSRPRGARGDVPVSHPHIATCATSRRGEDGAENPVSSDATRPNHPENGGPCGFVCVLRDMPFHRSTCDNRVTNCSFAGFGCEWRGSVRRPDAHRRACRFQPRPCPNGCGAEVSVGSMMMKHLDVCPFGEVACDAPDAEEDPDDPAPARCAAVVRRRDLARHRKEECEFARASRCRRCRALVSFEARRRTRRHGARRRANRVRGTAARRLKSEIEAHLRETMPAGRRRLPVQRPGVRRDGGARIDGFAPPTRRGRAP